ncbi:hypothetical protein [Vibrio aestuarianus]|uniref:hypothetical protein n=1 Tax=Vibrio aestuarianus TaxID=28171 RepID=UPI00237D23E5|nr:hypothetical protein [Vibrio aestuarianus]MDE1337658.1 hypothetical protein [Vibrio aestuarianus]
MTSFLKQTTRQEPTWPPKAINLKPVIPLPCPMRQPDLAPTTTLSFQPKRKTMLNCRGNCQAKMLIGKEPQSDFEPVKHEANRHDLTMKQPANIGMFYGQRDSRT